MMDSDANQSPVDTTLEAKPQPPNPDDYTGCCDSGCSPCVYDLYWEAQARYEVALAEWNLRSQTVR
jgi:hypothetical protein